MLTEPNRTNSGARVISGTEVARRIMRELNTKAKTFAGQTGILPHLAVILLGDNPASHIYVRSKAKAAAECGFRSTRHDLLEATGQQEILDLIAQLNEDPAVHGILVQLPLPPHINAIRVIEAIAPHKDVDGFHPHNVGQLTVGLGGRYFTPCTPAGCMVLIEEAMGKTLAGKDAVVIGRSNIVGKPMATLLGAAEATVTSAHAKTRNLENICRQADLIVAAAGAPNLVRKSWVKPGAVLIDVGINRVIDSAQKSGIVGDIAFDECRPVASAITPVPGGVGPMTIAMLMSNTLTAAQMQ